MILIPFINLEKINFFGFMHKVVAPSVSNFVPSGRIINKENWFFLNYKKMVRDRA